jgi:hypothetical protein
MQFSLGICSCMCVAYFSRALTLLSVLQFPMLGANIFRTILMAPLLKDADCYLDVHTIGDVDVGCFSSENCQFSYCGLVEVTG